MNFSDQFKRIRTNAGLSQQEAADKLFVSRQAISNWENDKNLPDIEMLISISRLFNVSLDELILQDNMTKKLIKDTSVNTRAKYLLIGAIACAIEMNFGIILIVIKALSTEYIDEAGILHENFFLLPIGFFFIIVGFISMIIALIVRKVILKKGNRN